MVKFRFFESCVADPSLLREISERFVERTRTDPSHGFTDINHYLVYEYPVRIATMRLNASLMDEQVLTYLLRACGHIGATLACHFLVTNRVKKPGGKDKTKEKRKNKTK